MYDPARPGSSKEDDVNRGDTPEIAKLKTGAAQNSPLFRVAGAVPEPLSRRAGGADGRRYENGRQGGESEHPAKCD